MARSGAARSGCRASLIAFMMQAGAPAVPASPRSLGAQFGVGGRRDHMADFDIGHFDCHRDQIVHHVAVDELAGFVVDAMFIERAADPLHDAAADLLVDELRVDDGAAILHAPMA